MKFEDLKKDSFIKWKAARAFKTWSTFGKVVELTELSVIILTFDDFKTTTISKFGDAIRDEIELTTKDELEDFIKISISELNVRKTEIEVKFKNDIKKINSILEELNKNL